MKLSFAALLLCSTWAIPLHAETLRGKVIGVSDGDTITILDADKIQHKVRLAGIDAPEKSQAFGEHSKQHLGNLVFGNGEHRVPFYVIAGAALANAYRIKDATTHQGVGIMILDEAFYGIDAQNSFATMEFLNSLGLQVILAGPDTDLGKLLPLMDTYYELIRPNNSTDVFADYIVVKEPTRRALLSDMPDRNPELVERAVAQMSLVMP